ncbi:hypothetical protein O6H91_02G106700 [Diphasiastrum complanatum]|uniref:Uncharacterized protein n=2 Tax=Diphasiastrum complanatum TaxID=34168 RepID=A0ACC2EJC7_DIPCM|nr:hypothetical protein O6H91_02G106700 [Diphasiastrum complanatum]KAJ7566513.1 hypothetical protein O6H91_02G106700 [Diphasiastrum complanatum]
MASCLDPVAASLDTVSERKERLQKAFIELESQREALSNCTSEWKELEEHFSSVEKAVQKRLEEVAEKEKALEAKAQEMQEALKKREEVIFAREEASLSRVQEQKDLAIAAIFEEKRKWQEQKKRQDSDAPAVVSDDTKMVKEEHAIKNDSKPSSNGSLNQVDIDSTPTKPVSVVDHEINKQDTTTPVKPLTSDVKVRPQLKSLCENMDGAGLRKFIENHRKDIGVFQSELPVALQCAIDPARIVLDALEGYPLPENGKSQADKKESGVSGASATRRACILILEALAVILADPVLGEDHPVVPSNIKEKAKEVAENWKSKMDILGDSPSESLLDAQAFLQLLATFGIAADYNEDDLCRLITVVARRRQSPALCRSLGLASKIPDVVDRLANEGKQLEALAFAHSFGIMDRIQPVPLLKTFLKEARKSAQTILKSGNGSPAAQNDSGMKELSALKAVLKCIEEYKLEPQYPSAPLQRRVEQLEKAKSDRKRAAVAVKAQAKRPKASAGGVSGYASSADRVAYRSSDRAQYGGPGLSYTLTGQSNYDGRGQAGYSAAYGGASRTSVPLSGSHLYSVDGLGSSVYGSALYTSPSTTYNSYQFGSGLPPPPPAYQASFLH